MSLALVVINANEIHQMRCTLHVRVDENAKKEKRKKKKKKACIKINTIPIVCFHSCGRWTLKAMQAEIFSVIITVYLYIFSFSIFVVKN